MGWHWGILASSGAGGANWFGLLNTSSAGDNNLAINSAGDVYFTGRHSDVSFEITIAKLNNGGDIQWQRKLDASSTDMGQGIAVDSNGDVIVVGRAVITGASDEAIIAKYNSAGTIQWQRRLGDSNSQQLFGVDVDSSNNIYVVGIDNQGLLTAKYNSSGTIQWQRRLRGGNFRETGQGIAVTSSGVVYVTGTSDDFNPDDIITAKYNTSGTLQWQNRLGDGATQLGQAIALDSSENVYVVGSSDATSGGTRFDIQIAKYNSAGTLQFQRTLAGTTNANGWGITIDSSNNFYITGEFRDSGTRDAVIAKYNSSGAIQWQRRIRSTGQDTGYALRADSTGSIYVAGVSDVSGSSNLFVAKLPNDGSKTGTYTIGGNNIVYEASSLTDASTSLSDASSSLSGSTPSLTSQASTLTDASTSLTWSVVKF